MPQKKTKMGQGSHMTGTQIKEALVDGYKLTYHSFKVGKKEMIHLMVYITGKDNTPVTDASVEFLVKTPQNKEVKVSAMKMQSGFGGNIAFPQKGKYTIQTKVAIGERSLMDTMEYDAKQ